MAWVLAVIGVRVLSTSWYLTFSIQVPMSVYVYFPECTSDHKLAKCNLSVTMRIGFHSILLFCGSLLFVYMLQKGKVISCFGDLKDKGCVLEAWLRHGPGRTRESVDLCNV